MVFWPKSSTTPNLAKVSVPMIRLNIGSSSSSCSSTTSGLTLKNLDLEKSGNSNSRFPTFVVLKVPFEVSHLLGAYLFTCGMFFKPSFVTNIRLPSEPESIRTVQAFFSCFCFWLYLWNGTAAIAALIPLPLTTLLPTSCVGGFSTILIGVLTSFAESDFWFICKTLRLLFLKLVLRS